MLKCEFDGTGRVSDDYGKRQSHCNRTFGVDENGQLPASFAFAMRERMGQYDAYLQPANLHYQLLAVHVFKPDPPTQRARVSAPMLEPDTPWDPTLLPDTPEVPVAPVLVPVVW